MADVARIHQHDSLTRRNCQPLNASRLG
jgi:hypothetical protein